MFDVWTVGELGIDCGCALVEETEKTSQALRILLYILDPRRSVRSASLRCEQNFLMRGASAVGVRNEGIHTPYQGLPAETPWIYTASTALYFSEMTLAGLEAGEATSLA